MAVYDFGYGIHTDEIKFRKGKVAKLIREYGDEAFRKGLDDYISESSESEVKEPREKLEEEFALNYEPEADEGYGYLGCIIRLLNTSPDSKIRHGFKFDGEFLYYPARFPNSTEDRSVPTETDIEKSIRCLVNGTTVDVSAEFVYDFADDC